MGTHHRPDASPILATPLRGWANDTIKAVTRGLDGCVRPSPHQRRFLLVHLDGVTRSLLQEAVETDQMPFLASLIRSGAYRLDSAFWGSPASTPAFQAGLIYGLRHPNLPAYNWYDRELGREVRMNAPRDALAIEQRLARMGRGSLLGTEGAAHLTLFRGGAEDMLCMSTLAKTQTILRALPRALRGIRGPARRSVGRFISSLFRDAWDTLHDVRAWVRRVEDWRHERQYVLNRFFVIGLAWSLAVTRTLIDMIAGVPSIYLVFGNYDEVSHRRGPFSPQARSLLYRVDAQLAELFAIARAVDPPYDVYFLSDHGHVGSAPFEQRRGQRLRQYLLHGEPVPIPGDVERALLDGRTPLVVPEGRTPSEPVVIEAGNFSHVYLERGAGPLEARELLGTHPDLLARAVRQADIGLVAVRRGTSAVAIIQGQVYRPDQIESAPLSATFDRRAVADLLRELPHMSTAGDIVLYGEAVSRTETVGFAWEFGSHGGLSEIEVDSVICWPTSAPVSFSGLRHATELHDRLSEVYRS